MPARVGFESYAFRCIGTGSRGGPDTRLLSGSA
jgi:hypothetical protein